MKQKTKKIALKRFKLTKNGKILRSRQNGQHLRKNKSKRQVRSFKKTSMVSKSFSRSITRMLSA